MHTDDSFISRPLIVVERRTHWKYQIRRRRSFPLHLPYLHHPQYRHPLQPTDHYPNRPRYPKYVRPKDEFPSIRTRYTTEPSSRRPTLSLSLLWVIIARRATQSSVVYSRECIPIGCASSFFITPSVIRSPTRRPAIPRKMSPLATVMTLAIGLTATPSVTATTASVATSASATSSGRALSPTV